MGDMDSPAQKVLNSALTFAVLAEQMDTENIWERWTCGEIEALADILRAVERHATAEMIVSWHIASDDRENATRHPSKDLTAEGSY